LARKLSSDINPTNEAAFPTDSFYHMSSDTSYVVEPKGKGIQFHIFVDRTLAPPDIDIAIMIKKQTNNAYLTEPWFIVAAVYNLPSVTKMRDWFEDAEVKLLDTTNGRNPIQRSGHRQAPASSPVSIPRTTLHAVAEHTDQQGYFRTPQNFEKSVNSNPARKFQMLQSADSVLDGFSQVQLYSIIK
jgi:hypothetical protein